VRRTALRLALLAGALLGGGGIAAMAAHAPGRALDRHDASLRVVNGIWSRNGAPFTGTLTDRDPSTGERMETPIVDGRVHGTDRAWFANGQRMYERRFEQGRESGVHEGWYADGRQHFRYTYVDGVLEGRSLEWYPNGAMYRDFTYRAGHEEGPERMWFPNGTLRANYVVRSGRRFGLPGSKGCTGSDSSLASTTPSAASTAAPSL
jgi:antitoxin component YwqK of YwqJK toxin-antitoxin module